MVKITENQSVTMDSLRGLSAILVMFAHIYQLYLAPFNAHAFYYVGLISQSSVMLFFILSGILIGVSVQNNMSRNSGKLNYAEYVKQRLIRIYPPLVFTLILTAIMSFFVTCIFMDSSGFKTPHQYAKNYSFIFNPMEYISTLTFTNNFTANQIASNAVLWSLPFEVWFYALAAVIMTRNFISILLAFMFVLLLQDVNIKTLFYASIWFVSFFASFFVFDSKRKNTPYMLHMVLLALLAYFIFQHNLNTVKPNHQLNLYCAIGIVMIYVIYYAIRFDLKFSLFKECADFSYTLYLTHFPILFFAMYIAWNLKLNDISSLLVLSVLAPIPCILFAKSAACFCENKRWVSELIGVKLNRSKSTFFERA